MFNVQQKTLIKAINIKLYSKRKCKSFPIQYCVFSYLFLFLIRNKKILTVKDFAFLIKKYICFRYSRIVFVKTFPSNSQLVFDLVMDVPILLNFVLKTAGFVSKLAKTVLFVIKIKLFNLCNG